MPPRALKRAIETLLAHGGPSALAARRRATSTLILAYHNIVPDEAPPIGEFMLHLPLSRFRAQLDYLQTTHQVVDLANIRDAIGSGTRPRAAITFDDAYKGALSLGLPELAARGMPATMFVAPRILGSTGCWWDMLASPDGSGLSRALRDQAIEALQGKSDAIFEWARSQGIVLPALPSFASIATEDELLEAARTYGIRLAPHSWTHCNLAYLTAENHRVELETPLLWLRERFERVLPWLAYPYGLFAPGTALAARTAGYVGALKIDGGWIHRPTLSSFVLPRFNVNADLTADGFILRASGLIAP
jgi:peptidoglycan/xylan/chitin deacetylase (PgdA/CDA1 family)